MGMMLPVPLVKEMVCVALLPSVIVMVVTLMRVESCGLVQRVISACGGQVVVGEGVGEGEGWEGRWPILKEMERGCWKGKGVAR